jgi:hypothetical protein
MDNVGFIEWKPLSIVTRYRFIFTFCLLLPTAFVTFIYTDLRDDQYLITALIYKLVVWLILYCIIKIADPHETPCCLAPCYIITNAVSFILDNMVLFSDLDYIKEYPQSYIMVFAHLVIDYVFITSVVVLYIYFKKCKKTEIVSIINDDSIGIEVIDTIIIQDNYTLEKYNEIDCVICLEEYKIQDSIKILSCKHYFHTDCIEQWLNINRSCPMCRANNV